MKCRDLLTILSKCNIKQTVMPGKLVTTTQCLPNPALMFHSHNSSMIQAMQVRGVLWKYASNKLVFHEHGSYFLLQYFWLWHCQNGAFFYSSNVLQEHNGMGWSWHNYIHKYYVSYFDVNQ